MAFFRSRSTTTTTTTTTPETKTTSQTETTPSSKSKSKSKSNFTKKPSSRSKSHTAKNHPYANRSPHQEEPYKPIIMPAPSPMTTATSAVNRLVKEGISYHKELQKQIERLEKTRADEEGDENVEFQIRQEETAIKETRNVFPVLRQRLSDAVNKLEDLVASPPQNATEEEVAKAKEAVVNAKEALAQPV